MYYMYCMHLAYTTYALHVSSYVLYMYCMHLAICTTCVLRASSYAPNAPNIDSPLTADALFYKST